MSGGEALRRLMRAGIGLPLASNLLALLAARWWFSPGAAPGPEAAPPPPREADPPPPFEAAFFPEPEEAAGVQVPLADCLAAALDAQEGSRGCPSPCPPCPACPACEAEGERGPSLTWEVGFGGLLLLVSEVARWARAAVGGAARLVGGRRLALPALEAEAAPVRLDSADRRPTKVGGLGRYS